MLPTTLRSVVLADGPLAFLDVGSGPVVLFVHGFPLDHSMWYGQITALADRNRCIAPDLRGFGASPGADVACRTMEQFAQELHLLLDTLQVSEPVVYCGLSMGGYIAWPFWRHNPARLRGMILCDTRAAADTEQVVRGRHYLAERVRREGAQPMSLEMLARLLPAAWSEQHPDRVAQLLAVMQQTSPATIAAALHGMAQRPDMTSLLPQIACPTLAVCGELDGITPCAEMKTLAAAMPQAQFAVIPQAGHMAPWEQPEQVNAHIMPWLGALALPPS